MERILVFSDTHGDISRAKEIISHTPGVTGVIHLGDIERDFIALRKEFDRIPFYGVVGNNDFFSSMEKEQLIIIKEKRIFLTHGHYYIRGFSNIDSLIYRGMELKADIVLFGHTHVSVYDKNDGMIVANPGSLTSPRMGERSYGVIEIENGKLSYANIPVLY